MASSNIQIKRSSLPQSAQAAMLAVPVPFTVAWIIIFAMGKKADCIPIGRPSLAIGIADSLSSFILEKCKGQ